MRVQISTMLHFHDLYHVEVDGFTEGGDTGGVFGRSAWSNGEHCINNICRQLLGETRLQLGSKRGVGDIDEGSTIESFVDAVCV